MARNRREPSKQALGQQQAATRRGAPGRRFVGDTSGQRARAVKAERDKVHRMAEIDRASRTAARVGIPVIAMVADVVQGALRIGDLLVRAPFRIGRAFLRAREA